METAEYLQRVDGKIRLAAGEVWGNEASRDGFILGLMVARSVVVPSVPGQSYHDLLAEVLGPGFEHPRHAAGCRGHRHGRERCLEEGCLCPLGIRRS